MKKHKTLVLIDSLYEQYGLDGTERNGVLFLPMLRGQVENPALRALRKLHLSLPLPGKALWLDRWTRVMEQYDTIILADAGNTPNVVRYLNRRWPGRRVIVWYRNPAAASLPPAVFEGLDCEVWSFDPADCAAHGLRYNPQFYIPCTPGPAGEAGQEAFFVGQDKGRGETLARLEQALQAAGCKTRFCIVGVNSPRLPYWEIVRRAASARVIVDCPCEGQSGLTLRPLEALFYQKKLITTSPGIRQQAFYHPDNIFVWGRDDPASLGDFLSRPYDAGVDRFRAEYSLEAWAARFYLTQPEETNP